MTQKRTQNQGEHNLRYLFGFVLATAGLGIGIVLTSCAGGVSGNTLGVDPSQDSPTLAGPDTADTTCGAGERELVTLDEGVEPVDVALSGDGSTLVYALELQGLGSDNRDVPRYPVELFRADIRAAGEKGIQITNETARTPFPSAYLGPNSVSDDGNVVAYSQTAPQGAYGPSIVVGRAASMSLDARPSNGADITAISAKGDIIVFAGKDSPVTVKSVADSRILATLPSGWHVRMPDRGGLQVTVSGDGNAIAFVGNQQSTPEDTQVFLWKMDAGEIEQISRLTEGDPSEAIISGDGRHVAFQGDNSEHNTYLWTDGEGTEQITNSKEYTYPSAISYDGSRVLVTSVGDDLVPGDVNEQNDLFLWCGDSSKTIRISDGSFNEDGYIQAAMSDDGATVAYVAVWDDPVPPEYNNRPEDEAISRGRLIIWES